MDKKKDTLEQRLAGDFKKLAEEEEQNIEKCESEDDRQMPEGSKEAIRAKLDEEIEKIRKAEEEELYSRLSEEDRRALELGRKAIQKKKRFSRMPKRIKVAFIAAVIMAFAIGATAVGGPERVIMMVRQAVGDREIEKVNSSDENLVIVEEDEEEAYHELKDVFGIDPVRLLVRPNQMRFEKVVIDKQLQTAEMFFDMDGNEIFYLINSIYAETSFGIDVEDKIVNDYTIENKRCVIEVKEYITSDNGEKKYSAKYEYKGLEYFLIGSLEKEQFENIVENLFF